MSEELSKLARAMRDMSDMVGDLHWMAAKAVEDLIKKDGEIAKRDEELAACRVAVESCDVFRARIVELENIVDKAWNRSHQLELGAYIPGALDAWKRPVLQNLPYDFSGNPGTPATQYCNGWNDAGGYWKAHVDDLLAELAAIKAQEPVARQFQGRDGEWYQFTCSKHYEATVKDGSWPIRDLYAAPVPEAKAQGVVMPEREEFEDVYSAEYGTPVSVLKLLREGENYIEKPQHSDRLNSSWWMWQKACARLNAAHRAKVVV